MGSAILRHVFSEKNRRSQALGQREAVKSGGAVGDGVVARVLGGSSCQRFMQLLHPQRSALELTPLPGNKCPHLLRCSEWVSVACQKKSHMGFK